MNPKLEVVLFVNGHGRAWRKAATLLDGYGIAYVTRDSEVDQATRDEHFRLSPRTLKPLLVVGSAVVRDITRKNIDAALSLARLERAADALRNTPKIGATPFTPEDTGLGPDGPQVILYFAEWSGPDHAARRWLEDRRLPYVLADITSNPEARGRLNKTLGTNSTPHFEIGDEHIIGVNFPAVAAALARYGIHPV